MLHVPAIPRALMRLLRNDFAGVTTLVALALPVLLGSAGLAFDLNRGYQQRVINQRAADMGALGAALAYQSSANAAVLTPTAQDIARANGLSGATVTAALVNDFPEAGQQAVRVTVEEQLTITLGRAVGFSGTYPVRAQALASLPSSNADSTPCYLALSAGVSAISIGGGASIDAPSCAVAAIGEVENKGNLIRSSEIISGSGNIELTSGTLAAGALRFAGIIDKPQWNTNLPTADKWINAPTTLSDPWAGDPTVAAGMAELGNHYPPPELIDPVTPAGTNWTFEFSPKSPTNAYQVSSGKFVVPAGTHNIKKLAITGGVEVTFEDGAVITISQGVSIGGGAKVNFGNTDVYINGGFDSGSSGVTFGNGLLWIGSGHIVWNGTNRKGDGDVAINDQLNLGGGQHLRMGAGNHYFRSIVLGSGGTALTGPGRFAALDGITVGGDSELAIGNGDIIVGPRSSGRAITLSGGGRFIMGDGQFSANGDIDTMGGSRLVFGRTANHYVNGSLKIAGSVLFGAGRYTINGDLENGSGGTVWPYTSSLTGLTYGNTLEGESVSGFDMAGINVTFLLSGTIKLAGGARTKLEAATSSQSGGYIAELLLATNSAADANWTGGSVNSFAGTLHLPNAAVKMAGGNTSNGAKCLSLIARQIEVNGGAATGTACTRMQNAVGGVGGGTTIRLVG